MRDVQINKDVHLAICKRGDDGSFPLVANMYTLAVQLTVGSKLFPLELFPHTIGLRVLFLQLIAQLSARTGMIMPLAAVEFRPRSSVALLTKISRRKVCHCVEQELRDMICDVVLESLSECFPVLRERTGIDEVFSQSST